MMGTEGCKRAVPLGTLWQNNLRLDELCSTNKYRYTQMNRYIHLERYLLRSQETKKRITDRTEGHRGVTPVGLQSTSAGGFAHRRKLKGLRTHFLESHGRNQL